jgi:hypothetical protein
VDGLAPYEDEIRSVEGPRAVTGSWMQAGAAPKEPPHDFVDCRGHTATGEARLGLSRRLQARTQRR